jgi:hypothetical protein
LRERGGEGEGCDCEEVLQFEWRLMDEEGKTVRSLTSTDRFSLGNGNVVARRLEAFSREGPWLLQRDTRSLPIDIVEREDEARVISVFFFPR